MMMQMMPHASTQGPNIQMLTPSARALSLPAMSMPGATYVATPAPLQLLDGSVPPPVPPTLPATSSSPTSPTVPAVPATPSPARPASLLMGSQSFEALMDIADTGNGSQSPTASPSSSPAAAGADVVADLERHMKAVAAVAKARGKPAAKAVASTRAAGKAAASTTIKKRPSGIVTTAAEMIQNIEWDPSLPTTFHSKEEQRRSRHRWVSKAYHSTGMQAKKDGIVDWKHVVQQGFRKASEVWTANVTTPM
jgi:hypothetical protein